MNHIEEIAINPVTPLDELIAAEEREEAMRREASLIIPADGVFDWLAIQAVGDFAATNPARWRTIALKLSEPGLSQQQIADRLGINQATVARHLKTLKFGGLE